MQSPCFLCIAFTVCARRRSHYAIQQSVVLSQRREQQNDAETVSFQMRYSPFVSEDNEAHDYFLNHSIVSTVNKLTANAGEAISLESTNRSHSAVSSAITTPRTAKWRGDGQLRFVVLRREKPALLRIPRFLSLTLHHVCIGVLALEHTDRFGSNSLDLWFFVEREFSQLRISLKW